MSGDLISAKLEEIFDHAGTLQQDVNRSFGSFSDVIHRAKGTASEFHDGNMDEMFRQAAQNNKLENETLDRTNALHGTLVDGAYAYGDCVQSCAAMWPNV
ncbi:hypothetical protein ORV05_08770 [Amycolatopsis cynarae]|uniref:Uncharacterized protein n=1 Tax=Amycolatopsis cynarae TaxID=2995223 RepID=A0ABY7B681_9PSEU|nr:hypothetical protein [Amycolatopsis sp. HUAS 11-8]WAL67847.1 hypothetical protein ORV05_08770 [Amycolatopsis sp. HUAS 11-8]